MLEIFAIVTLWKKIKDLLTPIGNNPLGYQIMMVIIWILFELIGSMIGYANFPSKSDSDFISFNFAAYIFALIGAVIGGFFSYFFVKDIAEKKYPGLVILATIYLINSLFTIPSIFKWSSKYVFEFYSDFVVYHAIFTGISIVIFKPIVAYGFVTYNYRLGFIMGLVVTLVLMINTILLWFLPKAYGYELSITKIILPLIVIILLLTRYKNAFRKEPPIENTTIESIA